MLVTTLEHGEAVMKRLVGQMRPGRRWLATDTETQPKRGYGKSDNLIIGRADIYIWSICYMGESYSFATSALNPDYPLMAEWGELMEPYFRDNSIVKVFHYANYDLNVFHYTVPDFMCPRIFCTMIGAWKANAHVDKGLKQRAPLYGRHLGSLHIADKMKKLGFSGILDKGMTAVAEYAEQDVVQTDELYQMQKFGYIIRKPKIEYLTETGKLVGALNPLPYGRIVIEDEDLDYEEMMEVKLQELPYLKATIRAERRGFPFSIKRLKERRDQCALEADKVLKKVFKIAGRTFNVGSSKQLGELMDELNIVNVYRTKTGKLKTDAKTLNKLRDSHPLIASVEQYKSLKKLQEVYLGDPDESDPGKQLGLEYYVTNGRIHATANSVGAVTGRGSCSNPNLTQIPSAKDIYGIKECFYAPKGKVIVCLDYAQLELRVGALFHQDPMMIKVLRDPKGDLHQVTSDEFGVDRDPTAKQINFLLQFGGKAFALSELLTSKGAPTDPHQAQTYIVRYDQVYARVREWRHELLDEHRQNGFVRYLTGRKREIKSIDWEDEYAVHKAETTLSNNVIQGSGQDFLKAAVIRADWNCINPDEVVPQRYQLPIKHKLLLFDYAKRVNKIRRILKLAHAEWLLQVHDESLWMCDESAGEEVVNLCAEIMCMKHFFPSIRPYTVPIIADGGVGKSWKEAKGKGAKIKVHYGFKAKEVE